jgi:uncharacterized protein with FMN-binding domain
MKRVLASIGITVAGLVALLSFKSHSPAVESAAAIPASNAGGSRSTSSSTSPTTSVPSSGSSATSSSSVKTITGSSADTRWGPVQVKITVSGSKITAIDVVDYPENNSRDEEINSYAVPELVSEALSAQSADIDGVSGATYTSEGFEQSLQSAINKI